MFRPLLARIDISALQHNLQQVRRFAPNQKILAVIKANAYGHGVKDCLAALKETDAFGVACLQEALEIRALGYQQPITLIEGVFSADEMQSVIDNNDNAEILAEANQKLLEAQAEQQRRTAKPEPNEFEYDAPGN